MGETVRPLLAGLNLDWSLELPGCVVDPPVWCEGWRGGELVAWGWNLAGFIPDVEIRMPWIELIKLRADRVSRLSALEAGEIEAGDIDSLLALSGMLDLVLPFVAGYDDKERLGEIASWMEGREGTDFDSEVRG